MPLSYQRLVGLVECIEESDSFGGDNRGAFCLVIAVLATRKLKAGSDVITVGVAHQWPPFVWGGHGDRPTLRVLYSLTLQEQHR